jgi:hypothetical protein
MTRIEISAAAYAALCDGVPEDSRLPAQGSPTGGFYLWLDKVTLNKLRALRGAGEGYSEAIVRMAKETA